MHCCIGTHDVFLFPPAVLCLLIAPDRTDRMCSRDVQMRTCLGTCPWMQTDAFVDVFSDTYAAEHFCTFERALADASVNADTSTNASESFYSASTTDANNTCVKLQTLASQYVSYCWCHWISILCRCLRTQTVFLADAKMFESAHLSSAVAGINHNSCHCGTVEIMAVIAAKEYRM